MTSPLPHAQSPADPSLGPPPPGRDLPVNDPPPGDGAEPPVQDPPLPKPDEAIDADWPEDLNPEAHESAV